MDARKTLENLHKEFPNLSLDDLFKILDCYVEQSPSYLLPKTWYDKSITIGNDFPNITATTKLL
jgi:hypothetical protein